MAEQTLKEKTAKGLYIKKIVMIDKKNVVEDIDQLVEEINKIHKCQVCQNELNNVSYIGEERMFGMGDKFLYFKCANCGCLQISSIPVNLDKYYPPNYYSYSLGMERKSFKSKVADYALKHAIATRLGHFDIVGILAMLYNSYYRKTYSFLNKSNKSVFDFSSKILDIGCGNGLFLNQLSSIGFSNLTGADPFLESDIYYSNGVNVYKKYISELEGRYDLIMLHHSFEHMSDPISVFSHLERLLALNGTIIIRVPVVDGYAWRKYGMNWFQIDAPRHFFLHTKKSISLLAKKYGLKIVKIEFDSTEAQILDSERYLENISLLDEYIVAETLRNAAKKKANELNSLMDGDQACFYIKR